jgi:cardiolipin synthase
MGDFSAQELTFVGAVIAVFSLLGILSAVQAVLTARTSQGAIAWVVSLLTWPIVSVPAYWIFGRNRFHGYISARRDRTSTVFDFLDDARPLMAPYRLDLGSQYGEALVLEKLAQMPFTRGNDTALLIDGQDTFRAIFDAIDEAQQYILVEFFIINDDKLGGELKSRLIRQARTGVAVYLLYDDIGSAKMTKPYIQELVDAGVHVTGMNTTRGWQNPFQLNFRNHRKIVVVDGKVAFIGGHNVGDEYLGEHPRLTPWRDTHVSISGPAVMAAQVVFVEDWYWATQSMPEIPWQPYASETDDKTVFVLPSGPADEFETCGLYFTHVINSARDRVWIASPYFVPDEGIVTAMQLAALRGVDVRVLIPGLPDKPFIKLAAMSYVAQVREAGVKMYEYDDGFLHQKVVLIDSDVCSIGTANLDNRSFRLNFEVSVLIADADFSKQVEEMLIRDFEKSTEIDSDSLASRSRLSKLGSGVARLFSPIL